MNKKLITVILLGFFIFSLTDEATAVVCIRRCYRDCLANHLPILGCIGDCAGLCSNGGWQREYPWNVPC
ncbi:hypothetical protein AMTRI_Chr06g196700 [Amborella trichopoda]